MRILPVFAFRPPNWYDNVVVRLSPGWWLREHPGDFSHRMSPMIPKFATVWLFLVSSCLGQVEVKSGTYYQIDGLGKVTQVGELTLVPAMPQITVKPVGVVRVETEAANIEVAISDAARVPYEAAKLDAKTWIINKPGRWWVDVTAIDFEKNIYGRKSAVVDVGEAPGPGPGPNPPPSPVPNEYGVGKVAYENAPRDVASAVRFASIYRQAGDFLFGVPSLKFIESNSSVHSADPNRSVLAWIKQQYDLVQCPDVETCKQWNTWKLKINEAMLESQRKRAFTRQDWFSAFREIANAVEQVK